MAALNESQIRAQAITLLEEKYSYSVIVKKLGHSKSWISKWANRATSSIQTKRCGVDIKVVESPCWLLPLKNWLSSLNVRGQKQSAEIIKSVKRKNALLEAKRQSSVICARRYTRTRYTRRYIRRTGIHVKSLSRMVEHKYQWIHLTGGLAT